MIGQHTVKVYPDVTAGGWISIPLTNQSFDSGLTGWTSPPFAPAWTAGPGYATITTPNGQAALTVAESEIPSTQATDRYRVTIQIYAQEPTAIVFGVVIGDSANAASIGPFWAGDDHARSITSWVSLPAGTSTLEMTAAVPDDIDPTWDFLGTNFQIFPAPDIESTYRIYSVKLDYLAGDGLDLSCLIDQVTIQHGRDDSTGQPEASSATVDLDLSDTTLPLDVEIGATLTVETSIGETASSLRFLGRVTDVNLGWDDAGTFTPDSGIGQVIAVGRIAELGRAVVGDAPFPQELDGARVARVLDLAGITVDPITSDPGTVNILARDVDSSAALGVAHDAATSAQGILWETRAGDVRYADADHRRGVPITLALDACDILVTPQWSRTLQGMINKISLGYGVAPDDGEQPRILAEDAASIARYGTYDYSITTTLAETADASEMASLLLLRNSSPVWLMSVLPVAVKDLDEQRTGSLLALDMHSLISITGLPLIVSGAATSVALWVEGWSETLAYGSHEIELSVSGYCRTSPPPRWDDLSPEWEWDTTDGTWDDMSCLGPPVTNDRWADVPASMRWDTVPSSIEWDQWPG